MELGRLPDNFLLEVTRIPGPKEKVCLQAIEHYNHYVNHPDIIVRELARAMVGNLNEYYEISNKGSKNFEIALPHLSEAVNFLDAKNTASMDVQSTARIKSFYSTYEKLLIQCANTLQANKPIPTNGLIKDLIATRDVLYPRYQLKHEPQTFYRFVYKTILEYMEYIDELSKENPEYGFEFIGEDKQRELEKPKQYSSDLNEISVPEKDFLDYALEIKNIPHIYRRLVACSQKLDSSIILDNIIALQNSHNEEKIDELPLIKNIKNEINKETLISFRNNLEQEVINYMNKDMYKNFKTKSREDFLYIYKFTLKPEHKDFLDIVSNIDEAIELDNWNVNFFKNSNLYSNVTKGILSEKADELLRTREELFQNELEEIKNIDLQQYGEHFHIAQKLKYFSLCIKDYMRNPKEALYQSLHMAVKTPFGFYEKQFRTESQHNVAEYGYASHSNTYKPYEKENFHILKICTPLMPKRDETGEIISPIELMPSTLDEAIKEYYHTGFETFSGGIPLDVFRKIYNTEESFYKAMMEIGPSKGGMMSRLTSKFSLSKLFQKPKQVLFLSTDDSDPHNNR